MTTDQKEAPRTLHDEFLRFKVYTGFQSRGLPMSKEYADRIEFELGIVATMKYSSYFLLVADLCDFMRSRSIKYLVRGSGCGSVCVWGLGISHKWLDPIRYGLPFERFLNPSRVSNPDLDIDIQDDRRQEVVDYTIQKYGADRVARIGTFGTLGPKQAFRDVAKALQMPDHERIAADLSAAVPGAAKTLDAAMADSELLCDLADQYPDLIGFVRRCEGKVRHASVHAAGVIIAPGELWKYVPSFFKGSPESRKQEDWVPTTQWDMYDVEDRGLLKMDYLGLKTLRVVDLTEQLINEMNRRSGLPAFSIDEVDRYDDATWKLLSDGKLAGVFQVEKTFVRLFARRMNLYASRDPWQLAVLVAIIRPGMMDCGATETYLKRAAGQEDSTPLIPKLGELGTLKANYQLLAFQEDCMWVARDLAGFSMSEADELRRAIAKKIPEKMAKIKPEFIRRSQSHSGISQAEADVVWSNMETFARYGFNNCIPGDTVIERPGRNEHAHLTVEEMYRVMHDREWAKAHGHRALHFKYQREGYGYGLSLMEGGRVRQNRIVDIRPAGVRRVYRVTLESGLSMEATDNHKFPTADGRQVPVSDLGPGDRLYVRDDYEGYVPGTSPYRIGRSQPRGGGYVGQGFPEGEANPGFTDGQWSRFQAAREEKVCEVGRCEECGDDAERLELHHIDGDRNNSNGENLKLLCPSCHKDIEYAAGRRRRGQKGYPTHTERISSIEVTREVMTYDVEMAAPAHNFCVNRIVTCNSHAAAYGMVLSYQTAYLKANYPLPYMACLINSESGNSGTANDEYNFKVAEYVEDARSMGIKILPPCVRSSRRWCSIVPNKKAIRFGLTLIKGATTDAIDWLVMPNPDGSPKLCRQANSFAEFVLGGYEVWHDPKAHDGGGQWKVATRIGKADLEAFVKAGACDIFGLSRDEMMAMIPPLLKACHGYHSQVAKVMGGSNVRKKPEDLLPIILGFQVEPPASPTTLEKRLEIERAATGCFLSKSPFAPFDAVQSDMNSTLTEILEENRAGKVYQFMAMVGRVNETQTKRGKNPGQTMAFITLQGVIGASLECVVFPSTWADIKEKANESGAGPDQAYVEVGKVYVVTMHGDAKRSGFILDDLHRLSSFG